MRWWLLAANTCETALVDSGVSFTVNGRCAFRLIQSNEKTLVVDALFLVDTDGAHHAIKLGGDGLSSKARLVSTFTVNEKCVAKAIRVGSLGC